ncbi:MAG: F0F1 ATP synthase subunit B, partial [Eubacterium sp.]|nr:F0F1 ATP synthase subunit B [Eubacterium sp.]
LINLIIFFLLMKRFLFKPIMKVMDKRKEMIDNQFNDAENANNQALELKKQYEEKIENINEESECIISNAKENAKAEYAKIIDKAEADAEKLKAVAKKQAETECENERRMAREDIANLAMEAAVKVIGANVSAETNSDIFDEFLNESSESNESEN